MFRKRKKYLYQQILLADSRACQVRTNTGKILFSNAKGTLVFGVSENPFHLLKNTKSLEAIKELESAYKNHIPTVQTITLNPEIYEIQLSLLDGGVLLTATDKSTTQQTYQALENQFHLMEKTLQQIPTPICLVNKNNDILYANSSFITHTNIDISHIIGENLIHILPKEEKDNWDFLPIENRNEKVILVVKKSNVNHVLQQSVANFPVPYMIVDTHTQKIIGANPAMSQALDTPIDQLLEKNFHQLWDKNSQESIVQLYSNPQIPFIELSSNDEINKKTFRVLWTNDTDTFTCYLFDITPRKKLEQQLVQDQKMQAIGQLTGGIAHDFNNTLMAIIGFTDLLLSKHPMGDESFSDIMQIKGNAQKAASLVGQLLTFTRKTPVQHKLISVHDTFVDLTPLLQRSVLPLSTCKIDIKRNLGCIKLDPNQLTQIMLNLAVNAKDAMKNGGVFQITVSREQFKKIKSFSNGSLPAGDYIKIVANDTGSGIPTHLIPHIFDPFFTTKDKTQASGTGLGLSTVYGIINSVGGYIDVDSEIGVGTTFTIYLPRFTQEESQPNHSNSTFSNVFLPKQGGIIILADDEDSIRLVLKRALSIKGFQIVECKDAHQALQAIQDNPSAQLLITDMVMPGMDGEHLIQAAHQISPQLPAILMSGYSAQFERHTGDTPHSFTFISKPFVLTDLLTTIQKILHP